MENEQKGGWRKFQKIGFDKKTALRRLKKAELISTRHARRFLLGRLENAKLVRREVGVWALLIGCMIAGMGVQLALSQRGYMETGAKSGGTYAEAVLGPVENLNPLYASSSAEASVARLVFSSLYDYDYTGALRQDLATALKVDDTGKVYTVSVRKGVKWHDGKDLTANDLVYTVNLIKNPATRSPLRVNWVDIAVRAVDNYTIEFKLPAAYAAFPHALTFPVLPVHILADVNAGAMRESTFSRAPVGSGPFQFKLLQRADAIMNHEVVHLTVNHGYYKGSPLLDQFELYAYKNQDDIKQAIKGSEVNGAADVTNLPDGDLGSAYKATPAPIASGVYAIFNNKNPILADTAVRKALQVGTDTKKVRTAVGDRVSPLSLPFIASQVKGVVLPELPALDLAKAAVALDDAGWKLKDAVRYKGEQPLKITITTTKDAQYMRAADELMKQWTALGVQASVNSIDSKSIAANFVQSTLQARNYDVLLYELAIGADPDVYAYWHSSQLGTNGYNFANYSNKNADAALASARSRTDMALRSAKYAAFAKQWLDDAPSLALYQPALEYIVNKNNAAFNDKSNLVTSTDRYADILYWSVERDAVYKTP